MTHKHFKSIAATLAAARASRGTIESVSAALASTNPRFDRDRFLAASMGKPINARDRVR